MPKVKYTAAKGLVQSSGSGIVLEKTNATASGNAYTANGNCGVLTTASLTTVAGATTATQTVTNDRVTAGSNVFLTARVGASQTVNGTAVPHIVAVAAGSFTFEITNIKGSGQALDDVVYVHYLVV
jgi:hypothetical protein